MNIGGHRQTIEMEAGRVAAPLILLFITLVTLTFSCKREVSCEGCAKRNEPPVAVAGPDQTIALPKDSVFLDGSSSSDPDGKIVRWQWTKITGPVSSVIAAPSSPKTTVSKLSAGTYQFELKVTDDGGLSASDTVSVVVDSIATKKHPPVAKAGADKTIVLPTNSVTLDGSKSSDADNDIATYSWVKISGPSANITNPNTAQTEVTGLEAGFYQFELKVTDSTGLFSKDTVQITVEAPTLAVSCDNTIRPKISAQLIPFGTLSRPSSGVTVAAAGNKIVFAGPSRADIYDISTQSWVSSSLSHPAGNATAVLGSKIYFAGGNYNGSFSTSVEVYDAETNKWATMTLPPFAGRRGAVDVAAAAGDKVLFVSGTESTGPPSYTTFTIVDIYDANKNKWRTDTLHNRTHKAPQTSMSDAGISATVIGSKIFFAGNASDWLGFNFGSISSTINIYDAVSDRWSASNLSVKRGFMAAIAIGNKNYWAGGVNDYGGSWTNLLEVRDMNTGVSTFGCLSDVNAQFSAVQKGNKIIFFTSVFAPGNAVPSYTRNKFDIYDLATNSWSIGMLPVTIHGSAIISVNNTIYVAGGYVNGALSNQVWKLEF